MTNDFPDRGRISHVVLMDENEKLFLQEQEQQRPEESDSDWLVTPLRYLCVGTGHGGGRVSNYVNVETEDDFVSTSSSSASFSSSSSFATASPSPSGRKWGGGRDSPVSLELKEIIEEKLNVLYRFCGETKRILKEFQVRFEEVHCRFEDLAQLNYNLEKLKGFRKEVDEVVTDRLERSRMEMETLLRYSELLLPPDEARMGREMEETGQLFMALDQDLGFEIEGLENFSSAYQTLQDFLHERQSRFSAMKTRLVQVERNLVKDFQGLQLRLKGIQSILSVLERDHDSGENSEINRLLAGIKLYDYIDVQKIINQSIDLVSQERILLEEVRLKRGVLGEAREKYSGFLERIERFQEWYKDYMRRLSETKVTGLEFDMEYPSLVKEREEKRKEFCEVVGSARNLRASIFDKSAVDEKIEILQGQWKLLVEKVYRARSRKTM